MSEVHLCEAVRWRFSAMRQYLRWPVSILDIGNGMSSHRYRLPSSMDQLILVCGVPGWPGAADSDTALPPATTAESAPWNTCGFRHGATVVTTADSIVYICGLRHGVTVDMTAGYTSLETGGSRHGVSSHTDRVILLV